MKTSQIVFQITLDQDKLPEKITWQVQEDAPTTAAETPAISLALWDPQHQDTRRIDLWVKEMPIDAMKQFYLHAIAGMAERILQATGDRTMARVLEETCQKLAAHLAQPSNPSPEH